MLPITPSVASMGIINPNVATCGNEGMLSDAAAAFSKAPSTNDPGTATHTTT